jgi:hypothetical protein
MQNKRKYNNNTSGYPGVSWYQKYGKWTARISYKGKRISLGYFDYFDDAKDARMKAEIKYHKFQPTKRYT